MYKVHTKYQKLEQEDQIELFAVSMEEEPAVNFSGRKQAFASLESSVSVNSEKDGADGGEEGFVNIPVSSQLARAGRDKVVSRAGGFPPCPTVACENWPPQTNT